MGEEPQPAGGEKYKRLIAAAQRQAKIKVAVAHPCDEVSLRGAIEAHKLGLIEPILVGPRERIQNAARDAGLDISPFELVAAAHSHDSAAKAVGLVTAGRVEALMKGSLHTDELMARWSRGKAAFGPSAGSATASSWTCRGIRSRL